MVATVSLATRSTTPTTSSAPSAIPTSTSPLLKALANLVIASTPNQLRHATTEKQELELARANPDSGILHFATELVLSIPRRVSFVVGTELAIKQLEFATASLRRLPRIWDSGSDLFAPSAILNTNPPSAIFLVLSMDGVKFVVEDQNASMELVHHRQRNVLLFRSSTTSDLFPPLHVLLVVLPANSQMRRLVHQQHLVPLDSGLGLLYSATSPAPEAHRILVLATASATRKQASATASLDLVGLLVPSIVDLF